MTIMHLSYIAFFVIHAFLYFWLTPAFGSQFALYWINFFALLSTLIGVVIMPRSAWANAVRDSLLHHDWGKNIDLFHSHHSNSVEKKD